MSEIVIVLGAGASAQSGVPVMSRFLDRARDLYAMEDLGHATEDFEHTFEAVSRLQSTHSKAAIDIINIESVWTALEMAALLGLDWIGDANRQLHGLRSLIVQTVCRSIDYVDDPANVRLPEAYPRFVRLLKDVLAEPGPKRSVSVVTFNYDVALDTALRVAGILPDYAVEPMLEEEQAQAIPLLKLHGSVNWRLLHPVSGGTSVGVVGVGRLLRQSQELQSRLGFGTRYEVFRRLPEAIAALLADERRERVEFDPLIVPPTWEKGASQALIAPVWRRAAAELAEAEDIIVIGYSMPETDSFFRNLYGLATVGPRPLRSFLVFNPEPEGGGVHTRFAQLLGPGALHRFSYVSQPFDQAIGELRAWFLDDESELPDLSWAGEKSRKLGKR